MNETLSAKFGREYAPGEVLFREGESGDVMFVIQSGSVRISKSVSGYDKTLATLGPGEFFGEMAILNGKPRTATATIVAKTRCILIEARTLEEMVAKNSEIALRLIKKLAKRLDSADSLVDILLHRDPKARVLLALTRHAQTFGLPIQIPSTNPDDPTPLQGVRVKVTVADLAREVATDERDAYETMKRVGRLHIAYEDGDSIVVTELERLQDFVDFLGVQPSASSSQSAPATPPAGETIGAVSFAVDSERVPGTLRTPAPGSGGTSSGGGD